MMKDLMAYKSKALDFIQRKRGPVLVGEICLFLGSLCSLRDAETVLSELATEKLIRRLSPDELNQMGLVIAYVAV